jgi:hypothetical protein
MFGVSNHVKSLPKKNPNSGKKPLIGTKTLPGFIEKIISGATRRILYEKFLQGKSQLPGFCFFFGRKSRLQEKIFGRSARSKH